MTWTSGGTPRVRWGHQRLDQPVERELLVGEGVEAGLAGPVDQRAQARRPRRVVEAQAQGDGLDEQADQALELAAVAAGVGRADDQVPPAAGAREEGAEPGQQHHEQGRAVVAAEGAEALGEPRR